MTPRSTREKILLTLMLLSMIAAPFIILASDRSTARTNLELARASHANALVLARQIRSSTLHSSPKEAAVSSAQDQLAANLQRALSSTGLPDIVKNISTRPPARIDNSEFVRHQAGIVLHRLSPDQLARLVTQWSASEPAWTITGINLTHDDQPRSTYDPLDPLYQVRLTLERVAPNIPANATKESS